MHGPRRACDRRGNCDARRRLAAGRRTVRDGDWVTNAWVKSAILLYFRRRNRQIPLKSDYETRGVRCVAPGVARYGSFLGRNVILMPAFVNVGAYVGEGTMIDTWATVGSCAQIGANVHLSGGVGIGGVLEPPQASPVIVEDGAFIGSRCIIVEGVRVEREAVRRGRRCGDREHADTRRPRK